MFDEFCVSDEFSTFEEQVESPMDSTQVITTPVDTTSQERQQQLLAQQSALNTIFTEEGLTDKDKLILLNVELFNDVIKDSQSVSMRTLTRNDGYLQTSSNNNEFVQQFDRLYGTMPNGARKLRIKKLLEKNPCLLSADPDIVRRRIFAFERMCDYKKGQ